MLIIDFSVSTGSVLILRDFHGFYDKCLCSNLKGLNID